MAAKGKFMSMSDNSVNDDSIWRQRIKAEQICAKEWTDNWGMFVGDWKPESRPSTTASIAKSGRESARSHNSQRSTQTRQSARGGSAGSHMHARPQNPGTRSRPGSGMERSSTPLGQVEDEVIQSWDGDEENSTAVVAQAAIEMGISADLVKRQQEREVVPKKKWAFPKTTQQELGWHDNLELFGTKDHNHKTMQWE